MLRLKSRAARGEAENSRLFLKAYRAGAASDAQQDVKLDSLLQGTAQRAEELRRRSERLQEEVTDAERRLDRINLQTVSRATETELQSLNPFERSQRRILEDKKEEDLARQREEHQNEFAKVHRRLQSELIELRDYKVLLREFTRVRLEKLHASLGRASNGRQLRACVREMIRHGAQRILQKLEGAELPLEGWMCEVLVNCCHVEIRIEDTEARLFALQKVELQPKKADIEGMLSQTKQERFDKLFARAWEGSPRHDNSTSIWSEGGHDDAPKTPLSSEAFSTQFEDSRTEQVAAEEAVSAAEAELVALQRLLRDMRQNAAAVICTRIRRAELAAGGGVGAGKEAIDWGHRMLVMLVSEDFAKVTIKELQKSTPHGRLKA